MPKVRRPQGHRHTYAGDRDPSSRCIYEIPPHTQAQMCKRVLRPVCTRTHTHIPGCAFWVRLNVDGVFSAFSLPIWTIFFSPCKHFQALMSFRHQMRGSAPFLSGVRHSCAGPHYPNLRSYLHCWRLWSVHLEYCCFLTWWGKYWKGFPPGDTYGGRGGMGTLSIPSSSWRRGILPGFSKPYPTSAPPTQARRA